MHVNITWKLSLLNKCSIFRFSVSLKLELECQRWFFWIRVRLCRNLPAKYEPGRSCDDQSSELKLLHSVSYSVEKYSTTQPQLHQKHLICGLQSFVWRWRLQVSLSLTVFSVCFSSSGGRRTIVEEDDQRVFRCNFIFFMSSCVKLSYYTTNCFPLYESGMRHLLVSSSKKRIHSMRTSLWILC